MSYLTSLGFGAFMTADQAIPGTNTDVLLPFSTVASPGYNLGNGFDTTSHRFTAPKEGIYTFEGQAYFSTPPANNSQFYLTIKKNGTTAISTAVFTLELGPTGNDFTIFIVGDDYLLVGDYVELHINSDHACTVSYSGSAPTHFKGKGIF